MGAVEENICEAISILVDNAVSQAGYDKTIEATIVELTDASIGKHKVKKDDATFYAYSNSPEISYTKGTRVYVLVPGNNMSSEKTIIGAVDKIGTDLVKTPNKEDLYEKIGNNIINDENTFNLCSYRNGTEIILFDKNKSNNQLNVNQAAAKEYLIQSGSIICGATFKTALPQEQQYRGNYGITFALDFKDHTGNDEIVTRSYTVDVNEMTGTPYTYTKPSRQYGIYDIDSLNFIEINHISIFCYDFPNESKVKPDDIFVSDIELTGALRLTDEDLEGMVLSIKTPQGAFFGNGYAGTTLPLQAELKIKGNVLDEQTQKISYYWFSENVLITPKSNSYNKYGGQGWRCLNNSNLIRPGTSVSDPVVEWIPYGRDFTISKADVLAKEVTYRCVAVYADYVVSQDVVIKNFDSNFDIKIQSDKGTQFYYDVGLPTLTCLINGQDVPNGQYDYTWIWMDESNSYVPLEETPAYNNEYNSALANYNTLLDKIKKEQILQAAAQGQLNSYKKIIDKYDEIIIDANDETTYPLTRVERNKVFKINVNKISKLRTFKCAVTNKQGQFIGNGVITLYNTLNLEGIYTLVINNGTQIFNYTENGVTPVSDSLESPQDIQTLSFDIYDNYGNMLGKDILKNCEIQWIVPTKRTLLSIPDTYKPESVNDSKGEAIYTKNLTLKYNIDDKYSLYKTNNTIKLLVTYQGMSLTAQTSFTFTKDGTLGENGVELSFKIIPNVKSGTQEPPYPAIIGNSLNFTSAHATEWFVLQAWHNGYEIFKSFKTGTTDENKRITLSWEILRNKYNYSTYDSTLISVSNSNGFTLNSAFTPGITVANVIKCTIKYDGVTYYATLPLILGWQASGYNILLAENSGFHYVTYTSDGRRPQYDNANPFEITVLRNVNGYQEDVSLLTTAPYSISYSWDTAGRTLIAGTTSWKESEQLIEVNDSSLQKNQKYFKPADRYDGYCVNNAVTCDMYCQGSRIGYLYIPIHMMLNKHGFSTLEGWDGNSIDIDDKGGIILSPQVGAGKKETDNTFTGMLMGVAKESGKTIDEIGLFGFSHGIRTLFIDSEDGSSIFGKPGDGQIVLDPASQKALIYSPSYWKNYDQKGKPTSYGSTNENHEGLLIDLTTPEIRYGNGNFIVDNRGFTTIKGGGEIAGWLINDTTIWNKAMDGFTSEGITGLNSMHFWTEHTHNGALMIKNYGGMPIIVNTTLADVQEYQALAFWAGGKPPEDIVGMNWSKFYVTHEGFLHATAAQFSLPNASIDESIFMGRTYDGVRYSYGVYTGQKLNANYPWPGFYIGTTGLGLGVSENGLGSAFYITENGTGRIAGWNVDKTQFRSETTGSGYTVLSSTGQLYNSNGNWNILQNGTAYFDNLWDSTSQKMWGIDTNGNIFGRTISQQTTNTDIYPHWQINASGQGFFDSLYDSSRNGSSWSIDTDGNIRCSSISQTGDNPNWSISEGGEAVLWGLSVYWIIQRGDNPLWKILQDGMIQCDRIESVYDKKDWQITGGGNGHFYDLTSSQNQSWRIGVVGDSQFNSIKQSAGQVMWEINSSGDAKVNSLETSISSFHWKIGSNGDAKFKSISDLQEGTNWQLKEDGSLKFVKAETKDSKFKVEVGGKLKFEEGELNSGNFKLNSAGEIQCKKVGGVGDSWSIDSFGAIHKISNINPGGEGQSWYISNQGNGYFHSVHGYQSDGAWEITQSGIANLRSAHGLSNSWSIDESGNAKFNKITNLKVKIPANSFLTNVKASGHDDTGGITGLDKTKNEAIECELVWT